MSAWQPIETAPRYKWVLTHWFAIPEPGWAREEDGKLVWEGVDQQPIHYGRAPTHWMPLPPPPLSAEEEMGAAHEPDEVAF